MWANWMTIALPSQVDFGAVGHNLDPLQGNKPVSDHLVKLRQNCPDAVFLIHDLNEYRQILRQSKDASCVDARVRAKTLNAAKHCRPGEARSRTRSTIAWYSGSPCHWSDSPMYTRTSIACPSIFTAPARASTRQPPQQCLGRQNRQDWREQAPNCRPLPAATFQGSGWRTWCRRQ